LGYILLLPPDSYLVPLLLLGLLTMPILLVLLVLMPPPSCRLPQLFRQPLPPCLHRPP
jgi:hypothetical protein